MHRRCKEAPKQHQMNLMHRRRGWCAPKVQHTFGSFANTPTVCIADATPRKRLAKLPDGEKVYLLIRWTQYPTDKLTVCASKKSVTVWWWCYTKEKRLELKKAYTINFTPFHLFNKLSTLWIHPIPLAPLHPYRCAHLYTVDVSCIVHRASCIVHRTSCIVHRASGERSGMGCKGCAS